MQGFIPFCSPPNAILRLTLKTSVRGGLQEGKGLHADRRPPSPRPAWRRRSFEAIRSRRMCAATSSSATSASGPCRTARRRAARYQAKTVSHFEHHGIDLAIRAKFGKSVGRADRGTRRIAVTALHRAGWRDQRDATDGAVPERGGRHDPGDGSASGGRREAASFNFCIMQARYGILFKSLA